MTRAAAVILVPRTRIDIRRKRVYSWKQFEQLTTCDTGRSFRVSRRSRLAIARRLERLGQPSRVGFGKAVLAYFLPRATIFFTRFDDADRFNLLIRIHSKQFAFIARLLFQT